MSVATLGAGQSLETSAEARMGQSMETSGGLGTSRRYPPVQAREAASQDTMDVTMAWQPDSRGDSATAGRCLSRACTRGSRISDLRGLSSPSTHSSPRQRAARSFLRNALRSRAAPSRCARGDSRPPAPPGTARRPPRARARRAPAAAEPPGPPAGRRGAELAGP